MQSFIFSRLREPSTYAGLAGLIGSLAFLPQAQEIASTITAAGAFVASVLAIWLPERKS